MIGRGLWRVLRHAFVTVLVRRPPATGSSEPRLRATPPRLARRVDPCFNDDVMNQPKRPKLPIRIRAGEGVADPGYLLGEITELGQIAKQAGFGTLTHALESARLECVSLVKQQAARKAERRS